MHPCKRGEYITILLINGGLILQPVPGSSIRCGSKVIVTLVYFQELGCNLQK